MSLRPPKQLHHAGRAAGLVAKYYGEPCRTAAPAPAAAAAPRALWALPPDVLVPRDRGVKAILTPPCIFH
jgi:hypothetical protein